MNDEESQVGHSVENWQQFTNSIVLFDGVCNLCSSAVHFIIRRDRREQFLFASLQSETGQKLLKQCDLPILQFDSIVLIEGEPCYTRSTAALRIAKKLDGLWPLLYVFMIIPRPIRDFVYNWIAKNRYRWFGRKDNACMLPTAELRKRFWE